MFAYAFFGSFVFVCGVPAFSVLQAFVETMRTAFTGTQCPMDATLELVLPGLHARMNVGHQELQGVKQELVQVCSTVRTLNSAVATIPEVLSTQINSFLL